MATSWSRRLKEVSEDILQTQLQANLDYAREQIIAAGGVPPEALYQGPNGPTVAGEAAYVAEIARAMEPERAARAHRVAVAETVGDVAINAATILNPLLWLPRLVLGAMNVGSILHPVESAQEKLHETAPSKVNAPQVVPSNQNVVSAGLDLLKASPAGGVLGSLADLIMLLPYLLVGGLVIAFFSAVSPLIGRSRT